MINDVLVAADDGKFSVLILLYLSATVFWGVIFSTELAFLVQSTSFTIVTGKSHPLSIKMTCGVLQGYVLGPLRQCFHRLHLVQNAAFGLTKTKETEHITVTLASFHWSPPLFRSDFN